MWLFIIGLLGFLGIRAQEADGTLPRFQQITEADGLNSNIIRHILQLHDGRIVVTTPECFNLLNGKEVQKYSLTDVPSHPLSNYHGSYHVYADSESRLWLKDNGRVWCLNLQTEEPEDLSGWQMDDLFVDGLGRIWSVSDTTICEVQSTKYEVQRQQVVPNFSFQHEWGELQDIAADSLRMYLFFSTSTVACYDLNSHALEYTSQPFDSAEAQFYDKTSLVVRSQDGRFYQLRCGDQRNIFLSFKPDSREWRTVFETTQGNFHTLCIPSPQLALMVCPEGMWEIDLETGQMQLHSEVVTEQGDTLRTGYNTVFCDRDGGLWLGTFYDGLLYAPALHASRTYLIYYIAAILALVALLIAAAFWSYAARMRRRERRLMERLRELIQIPATSEATSTEPLLVEESGLETEPEPEANEFVMRAAALVEQNLNTPGYSVERLAADLCMERTGLYKKLTTLLDQTPTLFIRSIRMEQAARLLREEQLSVAEVAERTGFASAGYFSRLFQETYGCKPSEYAQRH